MQGIQTQTSAGLSQLQFSDATSPNLTLTLTDPGDGSGTLIFALMNNGTTVCSATVSGSTDRMSVRCNGLTVGLRMRVAADDNTVNATLTTAVGGAQR